MTDEIQSTSAKLPVTFVLDNSNDVTGERFDAIKAEMSDLFDKFSGDEYSAVELSLVLYEGFAPRVMKKFDEELVNFGAIKADKMPFLGRSLVRAIEITQARVAELTDSGAEVYKPWIFVLTDGKTFDDMGESIQHLRALGEQKAVLYMPFLLSDKPIPDKLATLNREKRMIKIIDNRYAEFFAWVTNMIEKRISLPKESTFRLDKADFEGWAKL